MISIARSMRRATVSLMVAFVPTAAAQGVAGTWNVTFDSDITTTRDSFVVKARGTGTLTLTQKGDSVSGTWRPGTLPPIEVSGTFDSRGVRLTTGLREREIRLNGEPQKMKVRTDWTGTLKDGRLAGVMFIRVGEREPPPRKWEATR